MTSVPYDPFACLYVIEIGRGRLKVGYTTDPESRLYKHRLMAEAHGCKPGREWSSPPGSATRELEAELIEFCASRARSRSGHEYFTGVGYLAAVRCAAQLCDDRDTLRDFEVALRRKAASRRAPAR